MHIPDGFISSPINISTGVISIAALGVSSWQITKKIKENSFTAPLLGCTAAFVFAAQMLNFPIGGGTSGHFLGAVTVAALMGPWSAFLVMALVLFIQCLGFADGGLTALGTNIFNMGIIGGFGGYFILRSLLSILPKGKKSYLGASFVTAWFSVILASSLCALQLAVSGTTPTSIVFPAMIGTHAIIGIGEALITTAVLSAIIASRPDILPSWTGVKAENSKESGIKKLAMAGLGVSVILGTFISPFASSSPDGLEKVAEDKGFLHFSEIEQIWQSSPLPDYAVSSIASEGTATGMAGLIGTISIFIIGFYMIKLFDKFKNYGA